LIQGIEVEGLNVEDNQRNRIDPNLQGLLNSALNDNEDRSIVNAANGPQILNNESLNDPFQRFRLDFGEPEDGLESY
jgi:hypothetical protein